MSCKNYSQVIVIPEEVCVDDDRDDLRDVCLHYGGGGLHDLYIDVDFFETDPKDVYL